MEHGLDANTAFSIVSIDIADIDVGENIGARLQTDQANADTRIARARAEVRRADAVAQEQQMKAKVTAAQAELVLADALVAPALAAAFRAGQLRSKSPRGTQSIGLGASNQVNTKLDPSDSKRIASDGKGPSAIPFRTAKKTHE